MTSMNLRAMCLPLCVLIAAVAPATNAQGQCTPDFTVTAPGQWTGDTCGAADDCDLRPSEEHIYQIEIPADGDWVFSLCDSVFDTVLYLGTTCCGQEIGFDDDTCAPQSQLTAFGLTAGTYYLTIEGYADFDCGSYVLDVAGLEPEPELACPEDALFGQIPYGPDGMWDVGISDSGTPEDHLRFDNFVLNGAGKSCAVHWWGLMLNYDSDDDLWTDCPTENPMDFDIRFYLGQRNGAPGAEQCAYLVSVTGVPTGLYYGPFELYSFATNLNPPCDLVDGWISIQGVSASDPDCWFLWISSPAGDESSWRREGGEMFEDDHDWAFCLTPVGEPIDDDYLIVLDDAGQFVEGYGSGWGEGAWYLYDSGWWTMWFYNDPFDPNRHKRVQIQFGAQRIDDNEPAWVTLAVNWSTPMWSLEGNPPIDPRVPPLPPLSLQEEDDYIVRQILVDQSVVDPINPDLEFIIPWYNPEWVSVDVMGYNIDLSGHIIHQCVIGNLSPWDCYPDNGDGTFGDGNVNIDDLFAVLGHWGACSGPPCPWDCHPENPNGTYGDGNVNIDDLFAILGHWGPTQ